MTSCRGEAGVGPQARVGSCSMCAGAGRARGDWRQALPRRRGRRVPVLSPRDPPAAGRRPHASVVVADELMMTERSPPSSA